MVHLLVSSDQLDGIAAAAILGRALTLHGNEWRLAATVSLLDVSAHQEVLTWRGATLSLVDVTPAHLGGDAAVRTLGEGNRIAYWCTDFPLSKPHVNLIRSIATSADVDGTQAESCSAALAAKRFLPHDGVAAQLATMAQDVKRWQRKDDAAQRLADVVASGYDRRKLVEMLSKGVFWSPNLAAQRDDYCERRDKALADLPKHLVIKDYVGKKFGFTLCASFVPSAIACQELLDRHVGIDVAAVIFRDGRIVFRRRENIDCDCVALARLFGGDGREFAAGGRIPSVTSVSGESFEKTIFVVDRMLKDRFLR